MYPVKFGHGVAINRIKRLLTNGHDAEALVTSVFTVEKVMRRTLKELIVSAGFTSKAANILMKQIRGFKNIKDLWACFDPAGENLPAIVGNTNWQAIPQAVTMRNKLVHGERVYALSECKSQAKRVLQALEEMDKIFQSRYGYSGWKAFSIRRKSKLHLDPRVKINAT